MEHQRAPVTWGRWKTAAAVVIAVVLAGAVVAVAGGVRGERSGDRAATAERSDTPGFDAATPSTTVSVPDALEGGEVAGEDAGTTAALLATVPAPRVVRTADLRVEVADASAAGAVEAATAVAAELGGFVTAARTTVFEGGGASGEVTVRVPVARFDEARRRLGGLGEVQEEVVGGEDVTGQLVDIEARLRSLQAEEEAYRVLLGRAEEIGDVLVVQEQLFAVRTEIEQLQAQQAALADAADFATLRAAFVEPGAPVATTVPSEPGVLAKGLERAVGATLAVLAGSLVVLGYLVPLAVLAAVGWGLWVAIRRLRRPAVPPALS